MINLVWKFDKLVFVIIWVLNNRELLTKVSNKK